MIDQLSPDPGPPPGPRRVGRYILERIAGTGAFSTVYRALDERLDDVVAVKLLADNHSLDPDVRERFLTEGRVLRRITSPHVVRVYDLSETEDHQPFLVLEYADRGTLAERVGDVRRRGWRPSPEDVLAVAEPLAKAAAAVHAAQVVHRDLSPGNILITSRAATDDGHRSRLFGVGERLVVADLGLCKDLALNSGYTAAAGTDGFRAPELRRSPAIVGPTTDLWSLSALMVWLISGQAPTDPRVHELVTAAGLPIGLADALTVSLSPDPDRRHRDPMAWLTAVRIGVGGVAGSPGAEDATRARTWGWESALPPAWGNQAGPRPWTWRLRHSVWLMSALPFGLTTWVGFMYIGLRASRRPWLRAAVAYGVGLVAMLAMAISAPESSGDDSLAAWQDKVGASILVVLWIGGLAHALAANVTWLRWRAAHPGAAHPGLPHPDPADAVPADAATPPPPWSPPGSWQT